MAETCKRGPEPGGVNGKTQPLPTFELSVYRFPSYRFSLTTIASAGVSAHSKPPGWLSDIGHEGFNASFSLAYSATAPANNPACMRGILGRWKAGTSRERGLIRDRLLLQSIQEGDPDLNRTDFFFPLNRQYTRSRHTRKKRHRGTGDG